MSTVVFEGTPKSEGAANQAAEGSLAEVDPAHYQFEGVVARGGAGVVLRARDRRLRRQVAVKQNLRGHGTMQARFEREAWLTARLQHPGIVPIYEAGRWPNGESFYAMRLVEGQPLSDVIAGCTTLDERLALLPKVIAVAEAVAYAHTQRVLHRDLKPHNVMIGPFGDVVVIDWGLAKDMTQPEASAPSTGAPDATAAGTTSTETVAGSVIGTPAYMPPEQARGRQVDERADVYALGALLYHVLTGAPPHSGVNNAEILDRVLSGGPPPVEERQPGVPRDLAAVVAKAMARDAAARYADAGELCDELQRFVTGQLVRAHQYSRAVLVRRAIQRHPLAAAVGVFALVLAASGALAVRRIVVEKEAAESRGRQLLLGQARALLETDPTASVALLRRYPDRPAESEAVRAIALDAESRGVARRVLSHASDVRDVAFSPDGAQLASAGADGVLALWDMATGAEKRLYTSNNAITNVLFDPRGEYLAASLGALPGMLLWDRKAGTARRLALEDDVYVIAFSPDSSLLAGGSIGGTVYLWSMPGGARRDLTGHTDWIESVEFSPDGRRLLSVSQDGTARLWTVATGASRVLALDAQGYVGVFSRDGRQAAVGCEDGKVHIYALDAADGEARPVRMHRADGAAVDYMAFSPDGARLAWAGLSRDVHVLDLPANVMTALHGHDDDVNGLSFLPDGTLVTASADGSVRRWDLAIGLGAALRGHADHVQAMAVSNDGRRVASAGADRAVRVWELEPAPRTFAVSVSKESEIRTAPGNDVLYFRPDGGGLGALDLRSGRGQTIETRRQWARYTGDPAGRHLAYRDLQRKVSLVDLASRTERDLPAGLDLVGAAIEFSPDGATLAFPGWAAVHLVDVRSLASRELPFLSGPLRQEDMKFNKLQFSSDGSQLLGVRGRTEVGEIVAWDVVSGKASAIPLPEAPALSSVFASRDLGAIAAGAIGGLWMFERRLGRWRQLARGEGEFFPAAFSGDGVQLAAADDRGRLRVWRTSDGALLHDLPGHRGPVRRLEFDAGGLKLVSAGVDGAARLWDLRTGQQLRALRAHAGREVTWAGFRGADVVTAGRDGTVRVWAAPARAPGPVRQLLDQLTAVEPDR